MYRWCIISFKDEKWGISLQFVARRHRKGEDRICGKTLEAWIAEQKNYRSYLV